MSPLFLYKGTIIIHLHASGHLHRPKNGVKQSRQPLQTSPASALPKVHRNLIWPSRPVPTHPANSPLDPLSLFPQASILLQLGFFTQG